MTTAVKSTLDVSIFQRVVRVAQDKKKLKKFDMTRRYLVESRVQKFNVSLEIRAFNLLSIQNKED